jgi:hypothetical protein
VLAGVIDESIESGDPEKVGVAVETACLSVVEREIQLLPVFRRHLGLQETQKHT